MTELKQYKEAIKMYKQSLLYEQQKNILTYYCIGECYEDIEHYQLAIKYYKKVVKLDNTFFDVYSNIGTIFDKQNCPNEALEYMQKAATLNPSNSRLWHKLGKTQFKYKLYKNAIESYQKAIEQNNKNKEIWLDYSNAFAKQKDYEQAIKIAKQGIHQDDKDYPRPKGEADNADLYYRLTAYMINYRKSKQAYNCLEIALMLNYDKYSKLFEYQPNLKNNTHIIELIETNKPDISEKDIKKI